MPRALCGFARNESRKTSALGGIFDRRAAALVAIGEELIEACEGLAPIRVSVGDRFLHLVAGEHGLPRIVPRHERLIAQRAELRLRLRGLLVEAGLQLLRAAER